MKSMLFALAAATATVSPAAGAQDTPPAGARIVMYRPSAIMGYAIGCPIRYKEQEVVELGRGKYAEWNVAPGHYILTNKTGSVDIRVDPGETAYVRCQIKPGMLTGRADLQLVDQESFAKHQADYARKEVEIAAPAPATAVAAPPVAAAAPVTTAASVPEATPAVAAPTDGGTTTTPVPRTY